MSRKYQGLIILNTKSLEGTVDELVTAVSKEIEAEGPTDVMIVGDMNRFAVRTVRAAKLQIRAWHQECSEASKQLTKNGLLPMRKATRYE